MRLIIFSLLVFVSAVHVGRSHYEYQWFWGISILIILLGLQLACRIGIRGAACFSYTALSSFYLFSTSGELRGDNAPLGIFFQGREAFIISSQALDNMAMNKYSGGALIACFIIFVFLVHCKKSTLENIGKALGWLCITESIYCLCQVIYFIYGNGYSNFQEYLPRLTFSGYAGIGGGLIAVLIPFWVKELQAWKGIHKYMPRFIYYGLYTIPAIAVLFTCSSVAVGTLFVVIAGIIAFQVKQFNKALIWCFIFASIIFVIARFTQGSQLLNDSTRFEAYGHFFRYWFDHVNLLVGTGNGSFHVLGPSIQSKVGFNDTWAWAHSDLLQLLFEMGLISVALYSWAFYEVIIRCLRARRYDLLCSIIGYLGTCIFNYPMHYAVHAFVGSFLVITALKSRPNYKELDMTIKPWYVK